MNNKLIEFFKDTALNLAKQSKCVSRKVGCLIIKDGRIISMGYNGTPIGYVNCNEVFNEHKFDREKHHEWSHKHEIHAEQNALAFAAKNGVPIEGCIMICTLEPCNDCLKLIIQSGINELYYINKYDKRDQCDPSFDNYVAKFIKIKQI